MEKNKSKTSNFHTIPGRHDNRGSQGLVLAQMLGYKKQPVKNIWGRILDLAWLKFAVMARDCTQQSARVAV